MRRRDDSVREHGHPARPEQYDESFARGQAELPRDPAGQPGPNYARGVADEDGPHSHAQGRFSQGQEELPHDHPAWPLEARYLALALVNFICTLSPRRIVVGGGVMSNPRLLPMIRTTVVELLNNYVRAPQVVEQIEAYVVAPALGGRAGVLGGLALAERAFGSPEDP